MFIFISFLHHFPIPFPCTYTYFFIYLSFYHWPLLHPQPVWFVLCSCYYSCPLPYNSVSLLLSLLVPCRALGFEASCGISLWENYASYGTTGTGLVDKEKYTVMRKLKGEWKKNKCITAAVLIILVYWHFVLDIIGKGTWGHVNFLVLVHK